jgi:hypothetical protein
MCGLSETKYTKAGCEAAARQLHIVSLPLVPAEVACLAGLLLVLAAARLHGTWLAGFNLESIKLSQMLASQHCAAPTPNPLPMGTALVETAPIEVIPGLHYQMLTVQQRAHLRSPAW